MAALIGYFEIVYGGLKFGMPACRPAIQRSTYGAQEFHGIGPAVGDGMRDYIQQPVSIFLFKALQRQTITSQNFYISLTPSPSQWAKLSESDVPI